MAESTLNGVITAIKQEGTQTRNENRDMRNDFNKFFETFLENNRRQSRALALADKPQAGGGGGGSASGGGEKLKPSGKDKKSLGMLGGLMGLVGGLGVGFAVGLKAFAAGLTSIGRTAPLFLAGAGALAIAIPAIGLGIAGALWITGKALPTFVEGMKSFEELDGNKLYDAGTGVGALGAGLAVFGVGGAAAGVSGLIGGIAEGITKFFGGKTPFEKVLEFQKYDFNTVKIKNNAEAMKAFAGAMAQTGGATAVAGVGATVGAISDSITGLFGGKTELPYAKLKAFEKAGPFDNELIASNADALVTYSNAMAKAGSLGAAGALLGTVGAISDSITGLFGGKTELPYAKLKAFQAEPFNKEGIVKNADALVAYTNAMSKAEGIGTVTAILGTVGAIVGSVTKLFGGKTELPYDEIIKFQAAGFVKAGIVKNAEALVAYTAVMTANSGLGVVKGVLDTVSAVVGGWTSLLGGPKPIPYDKIIKFQAAGFEKAGIVKNAEALVAYTNAMSKVAGAEVIGGLEKIGSAVLGNVIGLVGGTAPIPYDKVIKFQAAGFEKAGIVKNAEALIAFSTAMSANAKLKVSGGGDLAAIGTAILGGVIGLVGGTAPIPYDKMKFFGAAKFNKEGIQNSALALSAFGVAMSDYANVAPKTGFGDMMSSLYDGVAGFFGVDKPLIPYDAINKFGGVKLDIKGIKNNAAAVSTFGKAFSELDGVNLKAFDSSSFGDNLLVTVTDDIVKAVLKLNTLKDGQVDKAAKFVAKLGGAFRGITGGQVGEMSVSQQGANGGGTALIGGNTTSGDHVGTKVGSQTINHHYHHYNSDGPSPGFMAGGFGRI